MIDVDDIKRNQDINFYKMDYLLKNSTVLHRQYFNSYKGVIDFLKNEVELDIYSARLTIKGLNEELPCYKLLMHSGSKSDFIFKPSFEPTQDYIDNTAEKLKNGSFDKMNMERLYTFIPCFTKNKEILVVGFGLDTLFDYDESRSIYLSFSTDYLVNGQIECGIEECNVIKKELFNTDIREFLEELAYQRIDTYYREQERDLFKSPKSWIELYCQKDEWYSNEN